MIIFEQRRDFGEKLNATFAFVTEHIRALGLSLLYIVGPVALVSGIISGYAQSTMLGTVGQPGNPNDIFRMYSNLLSVPMAVGTVLALVAYVLANIVTFSYIRLYRERRNGERIEVGQVWEETQRYIGSGVFLAIASGFIIGFGMILLIIPGIYVTVVLTLAPAILVFEGKDVWQSISRSFKLITDKWWSTAGLLFVVSIVVSIVGLVFTLPAGILGGLFGAGVVKDISVLTIITQALASVGGAVLQGISSAAIAFQYFNLVELKEGSGLMNQIDSIGQMPPVPGAGAARPYNREEEGEY